MEQEIKLIDNETLDKILFRFLFAEPFFADIIRSFRKESTGSIPTAGVGFDGSSIVLYYNPAFLGSLTELQIFGLLKHECYHVIYKHISSRKQDPHLIWNIATDLAINSTIPERELPPGGLIPGKSFDSEQESDSLPDEIKDKRSQLSDFIKSLPKNKSSEWYMDKLRTDEEISDIIDQLFKPQNGGQCSHQQGDSESDGGESGSCPICQNQGGSGSGSGFGDGDQNENSKGIGFDHHMNEDLSEGEKDFIDAKINEILEEAVKRANENRGWGSCPASMRARLKALVFKSVDWKTVLRYFCGTKQRANKSRSFKKINRKYPYQHPGRKIGRTSNIAVYIDQSGSVSDAELQLFFSTLNDLAKKTTFTIFHFDCTVDEKSRHVWKKNKQIDKAYRTRGGGTDFGAVEMFHRKIQSEFDGYIIFTDGEAPRPPESKTQRCWVLCPGRRLVFKESVKDVVVTMSNN